MVGAAQADRVRNALARLEGLPRRGTVVFKGEPRADLTAQIIPSSYVSGAVGWTSDAVDAGDSDGDTVAIELPQRLEKHLGKTVTIGGRQITLPTLEQLAADEDALPDTIKAVRRARRQLLVAEVALPV